MSGFALDYIRATMVIPELCLKNRAIYQPCHVLAPDNPAIAPRPYPSFS